MPNKAVDVSGYGADPRLAIKVWGLDGVELMRTLLGKDVDPEASEVTEEKHQEILDETKFSHSDFVFTDLPYKNRTRVLYNLRAMSIEELLDNMCQQAGNLGQSSMCIDPGAGSHREAMWTYRGELERRMKKERAVIKQELMTLIIREIPCTEHKGEDCPGCKALRILEEVLPVKE